jgi:hypothetical protein
MGITVIAESNEYTAESESETLAIIGVFPGVSRSSALGKDAPVEAGFELPLTSNDEVTPGRVLSDCPAHNALVRGLYSAASQRGDA